MEIRHNYLARYSENATIDKLVDEYIEKGFSVRREVRVDKYRVDIVAEKDGQQLFIEVVNPNLNGTARRRIEAIRELVNKLPDTQLIVVPAMYQEENRIEFQDIEDILEEFFLEDMPDELDELSTHTRVDSVDSVEIGYIHVYGQNIVVKCNGQISVTLQYGSDGEQDDMPVIRMSYPFKFDGTLCWKDGNYEVIEVDNLRIDMEEFIR